MSAYGSVALTSGRPLVLAKWRNLPSTGNVNTTTWTNIPIFGDQVIIDTSSVVTSSSATSMTISEAGYYHIVANICIDTFDQVSSSEQRVAPMGRLAIGGNQIDGTALAMTGYIRYANAHDHTSLHLNEYVILPSGAVISVQTMREANVGVCRLYGNFSNVQIMRVW